MPHRTARERAAAIAIVKGAAKYWGVEDVNDLFVRTAASAVLRWRDKEPRTFFEKFPDFPAAAEKKLGSILQKTPG
jgi:hypothetical protein